MSERQRREDRRLRRLWRETRDWCRATGDDHADTLTAHRDGLHARPLVWRDSPDGGKS